MKIKRSEEELKRAVSESKSIADLCRYFGLKPNGGNYKTLHKEIKEYCIDTSHFTGQGWNVGMAFKPKEAKPIEEILVEDSNNQSFKLKNRLFNENLKERRCECCGNTEWMGKPIALELHHIDGDNTNNKIENLQILCPNCHAQTNTYRGLNRVPQGKPWE